MNKIFILEKDFTRKIVIVKGYEITIKTEDIWLVGNEHTETFTDTYTNVLTTLENEGFEVVISDNF